MAPSEQPRGPSPNGPPPTGLGSKSDMSTGSSVPRTASTSSSGKAAEIGYGAYICFYTLAFAAHWFGAARFDEDGDGDFDVTDAAIMLKRFGRKNRKAMRKAKKGMTLDRNGDGEIGVDDVLESKVVGKSVEEETQENLAQHPPLFIIFQVVACFGLWIYFAITEQQYVAAPIQNIKPHSVQMCSDGSCGSTWEWINGEKNLQECKAECNKYTNCFGVNFYLGVPHRCTLMSAMAPESGTDISHNGFSQYYKGAWSVGQFFIALAGLDSIFPGQTTLALHGSLCESYSMEVWRIVSYQFTHVGVSHVVMNQFMNLLLGIPLEGLHGSIHLFVMYNIGVIGGALCYVVGDGRRSVVGCSGGCYALLAMHLGGLIMNWKQTKFRKPILIMLISVMTIELVTHFVFSSGEGTSHTAHVGGAIAGVFMTVIMGRNLDVSKGERILKVIVGVLSAGLIAFAAVWWATNEAPAVRNIYTLSEEQYCWKGMWYDQTSADGTYPNGWTCFHCPTRSCIDAWFNEYSSLVAPASEKSCKALPFTDEVK